MNAIVIGASSKPERYSYMAVNALQKKGYEVFPVGNKPGKIGDVDILTQMPELENVDLVTMYLNETRQEPYKQFLLKMKPGLVVFNPGAENDELQNDLNKAGIKTTEACTLVMLSLNRL